MRCKLLRERPEFLGTRRKVEVGYLRRVSAGRARLRHPAFDELALCRRSAIEQENDARSRFCGPGRQGCTLDLW